jgi:uncharacterized protein YndB with AHSA1/START domain
MNSCTPKPRTNSLQVAARGEREIVMTRLFDAPRHLVWEAFTKPELLKRWAIGPGGWSLPICERGQNVGDPYRYVWSGPKGETMGAAGVIREINPPERMVVTERFDEPWYPGEAHITIELTEQGNKTLLTQTLRYESREGRDMVLKSPMEGGLGMSYDRMADLLADLPANDSVR